MLFEGVPYKVVEDVEGEGTSEKGQESVLLKLIIHNWNSAQAFRSDTLSLLSILDRNVEAASRATECQSSNANTTRQQALCHSEESCTWLLYCRLEVAIGVNVAILAKHVSAGNSNTAKAQDCIVNTIDSNLDAHISAFDTRHEVHVAVSDWHKEGIHSLILPIYNGLPKDDRHICMMEPV